ncbi:MAG TPA: hypothetical protein ENK21_10625 [Trueperaceae bacterium]|nr:hypothetical protein [Trueperaceae bacterium]
MEVSMLEVVLSSDEIIRGLKHYRRIAKQDLLRAQETQNPLIFSKHAEIRREIYGTLSNFAETLSPEEVATQALEMYQNLPFVTGTAKDENIDVKARENALENFFIMIGLSPKLRREARSKRPSLATA